MTASLDRDGTASTGAQIAGLRKAAGLTQRQLAQRANVSQSLLSKVEIGDKPASHALVSSVAVALRVPVERIHGQPYEGDLGLASIDALRTIARTYDLPPDDDIAIRTLPELRAEMTAIIEMRRTGRYARLAARLPAVLAAVSATAHARQGDSRRSTFALLVSAYYTAHGLAYRLGYGDLSESIEHKMAWAAQQVEDPLAIGLADWTRVNSFQSAGDYEHGLQILERARAAVISTARIDTPAAVTLVGSMHLRTVTLASRNGDRETVRVHLAQAYRLADQFGSTDQFHRHLTFGAENTRIHNIAAHVDLGEPDKAILLGENFTPSTTLSPTRSGHHYIDLSRAHLMAGDRLAALNDLQKARRVAPEQTRYHPMVRETTRILISLHRRSNPSLIQFANWLGLVSHEN
jgi:transcriptional regulator with XRE-family HTH domain